MEVILRDDVPNLGQVGDLVKVKDGYGRNYLIPQGLAYLATEANKRRIETEHKQRAVRLSEQKADAENLAAQLGALELHFSAKAGEGDKLFGSVTTGDIAAELGTKGFAIDKRLIELPEPIRMIGAYPVSVRLHPEVRAEIRVWVNKEA